MEASADFTEMCSGSEAGSYLRLIDFEYHSTLGLRVIQTKRGWREGTAGEEKMEASADDTPPLPALCHQRESSLLTTYWSESTLSS